jgi:hypothetical protein
VKTAFDAVYAARSKNAAPMVALVNGTHFELFAGLLRDFWFPTGLLYRFRSFIEKSQLAEIVIEQHVSALGA